MSIIHLIHMTIKVLRYEGLKGVIKRTLFRLHLRKSDWISKNYKDILFINGCALPHPARYRVDHQIEQLEFMGFSCDQVFYEEVKEELCKYYQTFIIFRCPITEPIREFIKKAHEQNKTCIYDIDDLVFDERYTNQNKYVQDMPAADKKLYNDGVHRMRETMLLCDHAITTTSRLATEMALLIPSVYINRNVASEKMVQISDRELKQVKPAAERIVLGYFSGSITHNEDFELILPVISRIMTEFKQVYLLIVGELTVPKELESYKKRIINRPFMDWTKLPGLIRQADINLAPLTENCFNEAKSENKWVEAALVKVPTVASDIGAFAECIDSGKTGLLCRTGDDWYQALVSLIKDTELRKNIADNAWQKVRKEHVTAYTGYGLAEFIKKVKPPTAAFILPSTNVSGGVNVAVRHASILKEQGYSVVLISEDINEDNLSIPEGEFDVISNKLTAIHAYFTLMSATLWSTVSFLSVYPKVGKKFYLVQGFETDFSPFGNPFRIYANITYCLYPMISYITISKWCQNWLDQKFKIPARYIPNGIDKQLFAPVEREFSQKIRILIEGNCDDPIKNVDESFKIAERLDKNRYEIWFLSNSGTPKEWYSVDRFFHRIPYREVPDIYRQCHILIKSSLFESFSYPPLEMMATGGYVVVSPNEGNVEYLVDEYNCLMYQSGDIDTAVRQIGRFTDDSSLRSIIRQNGLNTASSRDWANISEQIFSLYHEGV
ncbi:MAG: glycosyltransferase [Clostridiaceae bacterium]|nr:glycosyltransferase [Clostridiaceae bacterium]